MSYAKFKNFSEEKKHKECARLLRKAYEEMCSHADFSPKPTENPEKLANAYHWHREKARISLKEHNLLPQITTADRTEPKGSFEVSILLDNIRSAYNVGNIMRTFEAFGFKKIYFYGLTPLPTHKQVRDAAMGADQWVEWEVIEDLSKLPGPLLSLETSPEATPLHTYSFPTSFTLALGNEEYGISEEILKLSKALIEIPLFGRKNSLNVASAFSAAAAAITAQTL